MAHARLGLLYYYSLHDRNQAIAHWRQALARIDRLTEREALYVKGSMAWAGEPEEMARIWKLYTALYPDDFTGLPTWALSTRDTWAALPRQRPPFARPSAWTLPYRGCITTLAPT